MGYTRQLGQLAYLITFDGSGNITVPASLTQGSVTSSMLKADVGGKLVAAVAGTDFVAPAGLSAYVPTTRTLTINGTSYDLSADRSWTIVSGVSSFNTRTGAITLTSGDVTTALGYTPVTNARTLTINGTTFDLSADRSWSIVAGLSSFNTRTGAITLLDTDVTGALGYTPVTNARTITINGTTYDLSANRTWVVDTSSVTTRVIQKFTATSSQTTFTITGGYTVGMVDVFLNGIKLDNATEFTASNGSTVVLALGAATGDIVEVYKYGGQFIANNSLRQSTLFTATAGQTTFTVNYSVGFVDVFYNGSKLDSSEFTATNGTSIVLGTACVLNDKVEVVAYNYTVGAFTGVGGSGTTNYISKWTASGTLNNSLIFDNGTNIGIGNTNATYTLDVTGTIRATGSIFGDVGFRTKSLNGYLLKNDADNANLGGLTRRSYWAGGAALDTQIFAETGYGIFLNVNGSSSTGMSITSAGNVLVGSNANSADTSLLTIKQASTSFTNGIYLERGGERNGYFMYIGGAVDSLTFRRNYVGTQSDVMSLTRDGNVGIGTTTPATKLVVIGGTLNSGSSTNNYTLALQDPTSMAAGVGGSLLFQGYKAGTSNIGNYAYVAGKKENGTSGNEAGYLSFGTFDSAGNPSEKIRVTSAGQILTSSQPAFMAYGNGDNFNSLSGSYLWYPTVHFNRGNHYNASNGVFTAPIAGVYYFSWSDIGGSADDVYRFYLRINNVNFLGDYHLRLDTTATGSNYGTNGNRSVIINLSAGDTARIYMVTDNTNTFYGMGATTNPYHNFMGYLIG